MTRWQALRCTLGWHDHELRFKPDDSVVLRCVSCGSETEGWSVKPSRRLGRLLRFQRRLRDPARPR